MPLATKVVCKVIEKSWLTPTVVRIRFEPSKRFQYDAGQFLSLVVPPKEGAKRAVRRAYSFAAPYGKEGYELCIKVVPNGPGSSYLASLGVGEAFEATAPYGDFVYQGHADRNACFISTGTGIAPFRAMVLSEHFRENEPRKSTLVFGARTAQEIIYPGFFEKLGIEVVNALSNPGEGHAGFKGRVTDYLKSLPQDWAWHSTDFYICGNGEMIEQVRRILIDGRGVEKSAIFQEAYFAERRAIPIPPPFRHPKIKKAA